MNRFTRSTSLRTLTLVGLAFGVIAAPASAECIRLTNIHGYSVLDNQHLVLNGGASHHYLVTTRNRCPDMRFGARIGTSFDDNETVCAPHFEYIIPGDGYRCTIETIEEVDSVDAARTLVAERTQMASDDDTNSDDGN